MEAIEEAKTETKKMIAKLEAEHNQRLESLAGEHSSVFRETKSSHEKALRMKDEKIEILKNEIGHAANTLNAKL